MRDNTSRSLLLAAVLVLTATVARADVVITVTNPADSSRLSETVEVRAADLAGRLAIPDPRRVHVHDAVTGAEVVCQTIDLDGDALLDLLIFQSDFKAKEQKSYRVSVGEPRHFKKEDFKAYGRFVRERFDDFAWENDRVAHRIYGQALETWQREPLTSSAVDIWCKKVGRLVINDWYMVDDYHEDRGEGADFYSAGKSRGCGGSGLWVDGKLLVSRNFMGSKVIASGPIRVIFELVYPPWEVKGKRVAETKRISLDAGQNLSRFESTYLLDSPRELAVAAGIKKNPAGTTRSDVKAGWLATWEPIKNHGSVGCGIVAPPRAGVTVGEDDLNHLLLMQVPAGEPAIYYAGFGWDESGHFKTPEEWQKYLEEFGRRLGSPLKVEIREGVAAGSQ